MCSELAEDDATSIVATTPRAWRTVLGDKGIKLNFVLGSTAARTPKHFGRDRLINKSLVRYACAPSVMDVSMDARTARVEWQKMKYGPGFCCACSTMRSLAVAKLSSASTQIGSFFG
jgi:hypothetical protein